jgi:hypothetical protein
VLSSIVNKERNNYNWYNWNFELRI